MALETVSSVCGKLLSPLYHYVESVWGDDVEKLVQTLNEADPDIAAVFSYPVCLALESLRLPGWANTVIVLRVQDDDEDIYVISEPDESLDVSGSDTPRLEDTPQFPSATSAHYRELKYVKSLVPECNNEAGPSRPRSNTGSIPAIIITPAPYQAPEKSAWVPIQNTCFGQRLTVPTHTALNTAHPPMLVPAFYHAYSRMSAVRCWTYRLGHWCALVPGLDEQERRGLFSRPLGVRRRSVLGSARKYTRDSSKRHKNAGRSKRES